MSHITLFIEYLIQTYGILMVLRCSFTL